VTDPGPGIEQVALDEWEHETMLLPPITSATFYSGTPPIDYLRERVGDLLRKNPWLAGRLVKKGVQGGGVALRYPRDPSSDVDRHFAVLGPDQARLTTDMDYGTLMQTLGPLQVATGKMAVDADEVLFKVLLVPVEAGTAGVDAPLARRVSTPAFALIFSMTHTIGDGYTYYRVFDMLDPDAKLLALDPVRVDGFQTAAEEVLGEPETAMLASATLVAGVVQTYVWGKLTRRPSPDACLHTIDPAWMATEKEGAKQEGLVPFVSSNDVITSWFLRETRSTVNLMATNLRGRSPAGLDLSDSLAGNYGIDVPYFREDVQTPALIRSSLRAPDGSFRVHRAADPPTPIPSSWELLQNHTSFITNWAGFYRDLRLVTDGSATGAEPRRPQLHLPIMAPDTIGLSDIHIGIVFCPREGELALMTMSPLFDSDRLLEQKRELGPAAPLGTQLI
jgi:hypothetical protein